jgi:hypothetical protein
MRGHQVAVANLPQAAQGISADEFLLVDDNSVNDLYFNPLCSYFSLKRRQSLIK